MGHPATVQDLMLEPFADLGVRDQLGPNSLKRHTLAEHTVQRLVNFPHTARTEFVKDFEAPGNNGMRLEIEASKKWSFATRVNQSAVAVMLLQQFYNFGAHRSIISARRIQIFGTFRRN
jgi:hypothetical protein